jgi:PAS domain S-box-containing protein
MPDADQIEQWGKWATLAVGYFGAVSAALLACWRYGRSIIRCIRIGDDLHARFGSDPVRALESALEEAHANLGLQRLIADIVAARLNIAVYICDVAGQCVFANDPLCDLFGLDSSDMLGRGWLAAITEPERLQVYDRWDASVRTGVPYHGEYTVENQRTKAVKHCETSTYGAIVKGKVVAFVGYVREKESK